MLRRWIINIRWLLNHPPIFLTETQVHAKCKFCGLKLGVWTCGNHYCACWDCLDKVMTKVLMLDEKKEYLNN